MPLRRLNVAVAALVNSGPKPATAGRDEQAPQRGSRSVYTSLLSRIVGAVAKKYKEVRQALLDAGWKVVRQRGSHEVWSRSGQDERIVVAGKDSDTVPVGTLGSIRRASGLEELR
jgi:predicted RNA binding protein YcfA (HicA-like mRNA interferase family)